MPHSCLRVLDVACVTPSQMPTPSARHVKLSFLDAPWVVMPPIQRLFLYKLANGLPDFPTLLQSLKSSLAATLVHYLPLAGKLTYVPDHEGLVVDCSDAGVFFTAAEAMGADVSRLAGDEAHDIAMFSQLVPELDARVLPGPVLSVQVTRLGRDGVALGISVHHVVADGRAVWHFMDAWASACRVGSPIMEALSAPSYSREVIRHPKDADEAARWILKSVAPKLPVAIPPEYDRSARVWLARRTFSLDGNRIQSLKQRINVLANAETDGPFQPVSTFVALSALGWTAFVRSKSLKAEDETYLVFLADLRSRLDPPIDEGYFGNCISCCLATATVGDLLGDSGLVHASLAVQAAVQEMAAEPLAGTEDMLGRLLRLPQSRLANVAASPRFRVYETDFGFGKPSRVELVSMNNDGEMVLVGGKSEGQVQVSVSLDPAHMEAFKSEISSE